MPYRSIKFLNSKKTKIKIYRYKQNGVLHMLDRNRRIKKFPQRFQDERDEEFDIVITAEERVYDQLVEGEFCNLL